jgi:hypothetical protein
MGNTANTGLVAPSDIAELAGVTRAAVSNWRKRHIDFPEPAGGTVAKPLFDRADVERWLVTNGYQLQRDAGELAVWALINRFRDAVPMDAARPVMQAVLCARKLADGSLDMDALSNAARNKQFIAALHDIAGRPDSDPRWKDLVIVPLDFVVGRPGLTTSWQSAIEQFAGELYLTITTVEVRQLPAVSDYVLARFGAAEGRMAGEHGVVNSRISRLLARAASGSAGVAYDPACGIGEALLRLWQESPTSDRLRLVGNDINAEAVLVSNQRCFLYGADARIEHANVLERDPVPTLLADVVVAEPPFGLAMPPGSNLTDTRWALGGPPPKNNSETAWLQHAIAHLSPRGRGFVVTGLGSTSSNTSAQIRRSLVRARCIEAVVALPPKLLLHTAIPTALWILRSAEAPTLANHVTFFDMSHMDPSEDLPIQGWLSQPDEYAGELAAARTAIEDVLADDEANLNPRHWIQANVDVGEVIDRYQRAAAELDTAIEFVQHDHKLYPISPTTAPHTVSVRMLEKRGVIQIMQGRSRTRRDDDSEDAVDSPWIVTTRMIREGLPELPEGGPPAVGVASDSPFDIPTVDYNVTEHGDVLVTTMRTIRAVVDETGGRTLRPGISRIRVDQDQLEPHYVAECLAGSWNQRIETGTYIPHANIRDLEIPLLSVQEQIKVVNYLNQVRGLAAVGGALVSASNQLAQAQLDAIRFDVGLPDAQHHRSNRL